MKIWIFYTCSVESLCLWDIVCSVITCYLYLQLDGIYYYIVYTALYLILWYEVPPLEPPLTFNMFYIIAESCIYVCTYMDEGYFIELAKLFLCFCSFLLWKIRFSKLYLIKNANSNLASAFFNFVYLQYLAWIWILHT